MKILGLGTVTITATAIFEDSSGISSTHTATISMTINGMTTTNYYVRNIGSKKFLVTNGSTIRQDVLHDSDDSTFVNWIVNYYQGEYYTIKVGSKYLSSNGNTLSLYTGSTISDSVLFKITPISNGNYVIFPKNGESSNLALTANTTGAGLTLETYSETNTYQMYIFMENPQGTAAYHYVSLDVRYDNGYIARHGENALNRISGRIWDLQNYYLREFNIYIETTSPTLFETNPDINCPGNTNGIIDIEDCIEDNHGEAKRFIEKRPSTSATFQVVFTGHALERNDSVAGVADHTKGFCVIGIRNNSEDEESITLIHEIGHLFGTPDHYGKGSIYVTKDVNTVGNDYYIATKKFSSYCIYGENNSLAESDDSTMCEGCKHWINNYFQTSN